MAESFRWNMHENLLASVVVGLTGLMEVAYQVAVMQLGMISSTQGQPQVAVAHPHLTHMRTPVHQPMVRYWLRAVSTLVVLLTLRIIGTGAELAGYPNANQAQLYQSALGPSQHPPSYGAPTSQLATDYYAAAGYSAYPSDYNATRSYRAPDRYNPY